MAKIIVNMYVGSALIVAGAGLAYYHQDLQTFCVVMAGMVCFAGVFTEDKKPRKK